MRTHAWPVRLPEANRRSGALRASLAAPQSTGRPEHSQSVLGAWGSYRLTRLIVPDRRPDRGAALSYACSGMADRSPVSQSFALSFALASDNSLYRFKGTPPARQCARPRPCSEAGRDIIEGIAGTGEGDCQELGGAAGLFADSRATACRTLPGGSPTGAPPSLRRCPAPAGRRSRRYAPAMTAPHERAGPSSSRRA